MPEQPQPRILCWQLIGVGIMVLWAMLLLLMSSNKKEMKPRKTDKDQGKRESVLYAGKEGDTCEENSSIIMPDTVWCLYTFWLYKR